MRHHDVSFPPFRSRSIQIKDSWVLTTILGINILPDKDWKFIKFTPLFCYKPLRSCVTKQNVDLWPKLYANYSSLTFLVLVSGEMLEIADGVPGDILQLRLRTVTFQSQESSHPGLWLVSSHQVWPLIGCQVLPLGLGIQDSNFCKTSLTNHLRLANIAKLSPPPYYPLLHTF